MVWRGLSCRSYGVVLACCGCLCGCFQHEYRYYESGGEQLAYFVEGAGPPLVLIHGFSGSGITHWELSGNLGRLAEHYTVIAPDCRGHGRSSKPMSPECYGMAMVEDIRNLLDHLGIDECHIAGYSMGSALVLKFGATYPERVTALAACGGGHLQTPFEVPGGLLDGYSPDAKSVDLRALFCCFSAFSELEVSDAELAALPSPLLVLAGASDFWLPQGVRIVQVRPDAKLVVIPGLNHITGLFSPAMGRELVKFFQEADAASGEMARWESTACTALFLSSGTREEPRHDATARR